MSLLTTSEDYEAIFLATRDFPNKKKINNRESSSKASKAKLSDDLSEQGNTQIFLEEQMISNDESASKGSKSTEEKWEASPNDKAKSNKKEQKASPKNKDENIVLPYTSRHKKHRSEALLDATATNKDKEKLVRILYGKTLIPKQRWGINKILATLVAHQDNKQLRTAFKLF